MKDLHITWSTKKVENGFKGICYAFYSLSERHPETGTFCSPNQILRSAVFPTRARAKSYAIKCVKAFKYQASRGTQVYQENASQKSDFAENPNKA